MLLRVGQRPPDHLHSTRAFLAGAPIATHFDMGWGQTRARRPREGREGLLDRMSAAPGIVALLGGLGCRRGLPHPRAPVSASLDATGRDAMGMREGKVALIVARPEDRARGGAFVRPRASAWWSTMSGASEGETGAEPVPGVGGHPANPRRRREAVEHHEDNSESEGASARSGSPSIPGRLAALTNSAGYPARPDQSKRRYAVGRWDTIIEVHMRGMVLCASQGRPYCSAAGVPAPESRP